MRVNEHFLCDQCGESIRGPEDGRVLWEMEHGRVEITVVHCRCDEGTNSAGVSLVDFIQTDGMQRYWNLRLQEALERVQVRKTIVEPGSSLGAQEPLALRQALNVAEVEQMKNDVIDGLRKVFANLDEGAFWTLPG